MRYNATPRNWLNKPKSFIRSAMPVLNSYADRDMKLQWAFTNRDLNNSGLNQAEADGACPEIEYFKAEISENEQDVIKYSYSIKGSSKYQYVLKLRLASGKEITLPSKLQASGSTSGYKGDRVSLICTLLLEGSTDIYYPCSDYKTVDVKYLVGEQPNLF